MQLIIRADANTTIGTGHLMRCLALAQAWQDKGGEATFITACDSKTLCQRVEQEGFRLIKLQRAHPDPGDWEETLKVIINNDTSWVVLDGYHFDPGYQKKIKEIGCHLLVIDDMAHLNHYYADIILNQNIYAESKTYPCEPDTKLLLGSKYVLLRREFWPWHEWEREIPDVARRILVTMGGSDPGNATLKVLQALDLINLEDLEVMAVVGAANPNYEQLIKFTKQSKNRVIIKRNPDDMPELMSWADLAISAGGSTCWEMAFMGLPVIIVTLASNQLKNTSKCKIDDDNGFYYLGWYDELSEFEISRQVNKLLLSKTSRYHSSIKGRSLVDGIGVKRVLHEMRKQNITIRLADYDDCGIIWTWANDPEVRSSSFSKNPIEWYEHKEWYKNKLTEKNSYIFIATLDNKIPLGMVRFDLDANKATISIIISKEFRGQGFGSNIIEYGSNELFNITGIKEINAYIKSNNKNSIRAFKNAGYIDEGFDIIKGQEAIKLCLRRPL